MRPEHRKVTHAATAAFRFLLRKLLSDGVQRGRDHRVCLGSNDHINKLIAPGPSEDAFPSQAVLAGLWGQSGGNCERAPFA